MALEIKLVERGAPQIVSQADWQAYNLDLPVGVLVQHGVVQVDKTPSGVLVTPSHFVGEMRVPGGALKVAPKSPDMLRAMEALALRARVQQTRHFDPETTLGAGNHCDPAATYVAALLNCIEEGVPWSYGSQTEETSFPRGKLEFGVTLRRLASRGVNHKVVARIPVRKQNQEFIQVVRAAHELLPSTEGATPKLLGDAQVLIAALDRSLPFLSLEEAIYSAENVLKTQSLSQVAKKLVACSLDILRREAAIAVMTLPVPGGLAQFQDLEALWERCVQRLVECAPLVHVGGKTVFHGLSESKLRLFDDGGPEMDPDVVVFCGPTAQAIIDAKYKRTDTGKASSTDLYQLAAYVRRSGGRIGMLVHFSEQGAHIRYVGTTEEGAAIVAVAVSPERLLADGQHTLARMINADPSVAERLAKCTAHGLSELRTNSVPDLPGDVLFRA